MKKRIRINGIMLAANVLLIAAALALFVSYSGINTNKLREENLHNISNLNLSAANVAAKYFETRREKVADIAMYTENTALTLNEALEYVNNSTSSLTMNSIQLVGADFLGMSAMKDESGQFIPVDYSSDSYEKGNLRRIFTQDGEGGGINSTPEFTDSYSATRAFAMYTHITLTDENTGGEVPYTLMLLAKTSDIIELINPDGGYKGMSTVLTDSDGNYILSTDSFKAMNFFDYLYNYNDLSLDQRNEIFSEVTEKGGGELYYKNSGGQDCVFVYSKITGSDWYCVSAVPIDSFRTTDYGSAFLILILLMFTLLAMDVIWLRVLNRRLRGSMEQEQQANAAKSEFLSRMSHDIRTPLNGIIGSTILAMDEPNPPETVNYLRAISSSGTFLLGLVNDILDMSKVESGKLAITPEEYRSDELKEYLSSVISPIARDKSIEFTADVQDDGGMALMLDRLRFHQICFNLLSNAVKYTKSGGKVEFILTKKDDTNGWADVEITVRDNGIGMSEDFQKRMFESFAQENRQMEPNSGTGLGLAIVKNLVELMDGQLSWESHENQGTTFVVKLKVRQVQAKAAKQEPLSSASDEILVGRRVLLCEDNAMNMLIAERLLSKKGIVVEGAENGKIGLDMFLASAPGYYDAILMDVMMPVMDGLEATKAIRGSNHFDAISIPIIAMTANAYSTDIQSCLEAGMNSHVAKPVQPQLLYDELGRVIL